MNSLIILAFYLDVRGYEPPAVAELVRLTDEELIRTFTALPNITIKHFIIPSDHNHIQCVYPVVINTEEIIQQQTEALTNLNELVHAMVLDYKSRIQPEQTQSQPQIQQMTPADIMLSPTMEELINTNQIKNESNETEQISIKPNDSEGS